MIDTLPRTSPWPTRSCSITHIIIHHTAATTDVPPETVAAWHMDPNRHLVMPSIAYHYYVRQDGRAYQCNPDDARSWHSGNSQTGCDNPNEYGIAVCLSGSFMGAEPGDVQIEAARYVVATLRQRYGPLPIIGHQDVAATACPGDTWPTWRDRVDVPPLEAQLAQDWTRYPRPPDDTGAGVHGGANAYHPLGDNDGLIPGILDEMHRCGLRWVKLLDAEGTSYNACRMVLQRGLMPVVRLYRERPYPGTLTDKQLAAARDLVNLGVRYFERGNEPNVDWEWQPGTWPGYDWNAWTDATFDARAREWWADAQRLAALGAYVAIDACSPGGHFDDVMFLQRFFAALKKITGAVKLVHDWGWLAVHPAALNHPLTYPDDAVNQREHPGQTIHDHFEGIAPTGASNCVRKWEAVYKLFVDAFGFGVPVLATEGGFWPGHKEDTRYPETSVVTASDGNAAILRGMKTAPGYYLANMPWLWFNRLGANLEQGFERDAWKRVPGFGSCPAWEPATQPIVPMLLSEPCQRRITTDVPEPTPPPEPPPLPPVIPESFTAAEIQRCRLALGVVPATIKAAVEGGYVWLKEIYTPTDPYAYAVVWDPVASEYAALKLETQTWQVVAEVAL